MSNNDSQHPIKKLKRSIRDMKERHRERHRPSGFGFVFADRVDYLDPERWDSVTKNGSVFLSRAVLRVIEQHGPQNIQPRYAIIFREDKAVGVVAAQVVTITGERLKRERDGVRGQSGPKLLRRVLVPAINVATANVKERMLVAGNLLSWGFHGIGFLAGENPADLWPGVAEALYRIRRGERLIGETNFVMVKDVTPDEAGLEALHRFSYRPMETEPNMVLKIDPSWRSYDDYLGALDAKYRRNAKEQGKKLAAAGCVVEPLAELERHAGRLHELYLAVHDNASVRLVTLQETYLPALARAAGENFRCTIIRREDELLGFVTAIRDGQTALGYYIGFDRAAAAGGLPLYLRLLHATIGDAISWGCTALSLGRTALEPKAALGAKPQPMSVWLRHRVPTLNWMFRGLLGGVPHAEAPERNPFKARVMEDMNGPAPKVGL
jgi:Acetyltransferase (GNAT) domain